MRSKRKNRKTSSLIALSLIAVMLIVTGVTIAYLFDSTEKVVNTFTPSTSGSEIEEEFNKKVKSNVKVKNTGDIDAYVRADVVITWQDKDGNVLGIAPVAGQDYKMTQTLDNWLEKDGLYYYKGKVGAGETTANLIDKCEAIGQAPVEGYTLHVEILAETIQAEPDEAITEAWGVTPQELGVK